MPRFSIVLPALDDAARLDATLRSLLRQSCTDFEIIVLAADADADAERAVPDPRVRLLRQDSGELALARNAGINAAQAEWIAFVAPGEHWHPHKLAAQASVLESQPECGIVYGECLRLDAGAAPVFADAELDPEQIDLGLSGEILARLAESNWVALGTAVIRRTVFEQAGLFDPAMAPHEDWDLALRAAEHCQFVKLEQVLTLAAPAPAPPAPPAANTEYLLRQRTMTKLRAQYGMLPNAAELKQRQFQAQFGHGLAQYQAGLYRAARHSFWAAWREQAASTQAVAYLAAALLRSLR